MALIRLDSFGHYTDADITAGKWTSRAAGTAGAICFLITPAYGPRGGQALKLTVTNPAAFSSGILSLVPAFPTPSGATFNWGVNFRSVSAFSAPNSAGTNPDGVGGGAGGTSTLICLRQNSNNQCWLKLEPTGKISFWVGSTQIGQTAQPLLQNVWQYIEWQVVLSGTATGSVTIKIDGGPALAMTNLITRTGSVNAWDEIRFGQFTSGGALGVEWSMADMYLSDGTGADGWTGLKGPQRVDATYPNAPGSNSGWTRSTGADQSATVDEVLANGDTDYNSTNVLNAKDSLNFPSFPVSGAVVNGIQHVLQAKKTDAGPVGIKALARIGGVDYLTAQELFIPTTYGFMCYPQGLSPATGIPWTTAEYDAAEFGQQKTT